MLSGRYKRLNGEPDDLAHYRGLVVLVVNTATECGFTPQLEGLEALYRSHRDDGFVVLGFPANDFAGQEPRSDKEIATFCEANYGVSFPMFTKSHVVGDAVNPRWVGYLVADLGGQLIRVQVKTTTYYRNGRLQVTLATRGGNQSWSGLVNNFCPTQREYLFVHCGNGQRWFIPSQAVEGGAGIALGGPRYADFEVEPGDTLESMAEPRIARLADPRRGSRAVKGAWL